VTPVKTILLPLTVCILFAGCQTAPVANSDDLGSVTVPNTNVKAISAAAQTVFTKNNYMAGPSHLPTSISFQKTAGSSGKPLWGGYAETTMTQVDVKIAQVPGTNDYVLTPQVSRVNDPGYAGFVGSKHMSEWRDEFGTMLDKIKQKASGAGPG